MCGRYYIDDEMSGEILKMITSIEQKKNEKVKRGEIYPSNKAPVLIQAHNEISSELFTWGFSLDGERMKQLIINARAETVLEKKMFRESILSNRCLIPASGFFEWNKSKEKIYFKRSENDILYMAGIYRYEEAGSKFVILTTAANESMRNVHDRMPVIFEPEDAGEWLKNDRAVERLIRKTPPLLEKQAEYEQLSWDF